MKNNDGKLQVHTICSVCLCDVVNVIFDVLLLDGVCSGCAGLVVGGLR